MHPVTWVTVQQFQHYGCHIIRDFGEEMQQRFGDTLFAGDIFAIGPTSIGKTVADSTETLSGHIVRKVQIVLRVHGIPTIVQML